MLRHGASDADQPTMTALPVMYQFRVVLRGIRPLIWRRLLVRSDSTIADLHSTLQLAMGWTDTHLHCFHLHGKDYGVGHSGGMRFADDPHGVRLADFQFRVRARFRYEYDFHAAWQHDLRVERILLLEPRRTYPVCTGGKRAAPPEDCGGPQACFAQLRAVPGEAHDRLAQLAEAIRAGDLDAVQEQLDAREELQDSLALDRFDRRAANARLAQYARGDRPWLFAENLGGREGGMAMRCTVQVILEPEAGTQVTEIACLQRETAAVDARGLTLAEGKALLAGLQEVLVAEQAAEYLATRQACPQCGDALAA
jgi:hypothetical protein